MRIPLVEYNLIMNFYPIMDGDVIWNRENCLLYVIRMNSFLKDFWTFFASAASFIELE